MGFSLLLKYIRTCIITCTCFGFFSCSEHKLNETEIVLPLDPVKYSQIELEIVDLINSFRTRKGKQELILLDEISYQADLHNEHMLEEAKPCHHYIGRRYEILVAKEDAVAVSENVAYGYGSAQAVVIAWTKSDAHRKNILGDFTHIGISVKQGRDGKLYFTNIFIKK